MKLTIRYRGSNAIESVTLEHVESIRQTGIDSYAVQCFGNGPVTWRNVTTFMLAVDAPEPVLDAPHIENFKTKVLAPGTHEKKSVKVNLCYKCKAPFTFRRTGTLLERIDTATGKPHECNGRPAAAIVLDTK